MTPIEDLISRMKRDQMITQTRDGELHLRGYGTDARVILNVIHKREAEREENAHRMSTADLDQRDRMLG